MRTPSLSQLRDPQTLGLALGAGRIVLGASALAAPVTSARMLGLDTATAARVAWLTRMMAVRDAAIGIGVVSTRDSGSAPAWLLAGGVSDAVDAVVVAGALRQGRLRGFVPRALVVGAVAFATLSAIAARGRR